MSTSPVACDRGLPCSCVNSLANSSLYSRIASAKATSFSLRSSTGTCDHGLAALRAAATALSTSSRVETGTSAFGSVVAGLMLWRVLEVEVSSLLMTFLNVCRPQIARFCLVSFPPLTSKSSLGAWPLTVTSPFAFAIVSYMMECKYREHRQGGLVNDAIMGRFAGHLSFFPSSFSYPASGLILRQVGGEFFLIPEGGR